jgi:hypothetical protein
VVLVFLLRSWCSGRGGGSRRNQDEPSWNWGLGPYIYVERGVKTKLDRCGVCDLPDSKPAVGGAYPSLHFRFPLGSPFFAVRYNTVMHSSPYTEPELWAVAWGGGGASLIRRIKERPELHLPLGACRWPLTTGFLRRREGFQKAEDRR